MASPMIRAERWDEGYRYAAAAGALDGLCLSMLRRQLRSERRDLLVEQRDVPFPLREIGSERDQGGHDLAAFAQLGHGLRGHVEQPVGVRELAVRDGQIALPAGVAPIGRRELCADR